MKTKVFSYLIFQSLFFPVYSQIEDTSGKIEDCVPATFHFKKVNTQIGRNWDFGDGGTSTNTIGEHLYTVPGTYVVKENTHTLTITVHDSLDVKFTNHLNNNKGCLPLKVGFKDITNYPASATTINYFWTFGDGSANNSNPVVDHIISNKEQYVFAKLRVLTNLPGCYGEHRIDSAINALSTPIVKFIHFDDTACHIPVNFNFENDTSNKISFHQNTYKWYWEGPDNDSIITLNFNHQFSKVGDYKITLKGTNQNNCIGYDSFKIHIDTLTQELDIIDTFCIHDTFHVLIKDYNEDLYTYKLNLNNLPISIIAKKDIGDDRKYSYIITNRDLLTGFYEFKLQKTKKADNNCKVEVTKKIFIINMYANHRLMLDNNCSFPLHDSLLGFGFSDFVDSFGFHNIIFDKYNMRFHDTIRGKSIANPLIIDTVLPFDVNNINNRRDFYRMGDFTSEIFFKLYNIKYGCTESYRTFPVYRDNIFYSFLTSNTTRGCKPFKTKFSIKTYHDHMIKEFKLYLGNGDSIIIQNDSTYTYTYSDTGTFKAIAIVESTQGCIDTTNPIYIYVGDSVPPTITFDKNTICIGDTINIQVVGDTAYDELQFVSDKYAQLSCNSSSTSRQWSGNFETGVNHIYTYGNKNGCIAKGIDSFFVNGSKFTLDYIHRCQNRDSFLFLLKDTQNLSSANIHWSFGDGNTLTTSATKVWHKYSIDSFLKVKVTATKGQCIYSDSVNIYVQNVKAQFLDTIFCKSKIPKDSLVSTDFPFKLNPTLSKNAKYLCGYTYTWYVEKNSVKYPYITSDTSVNVNLPTDTSQLYLIARDKNGCTDILMRNIYVIDYNTNFTLEKHHLCFDNDTIRYRNTSSGHFEIDSFVWELRKYLPTSAELDSAFKISLNDSVGTMALKTKELSDQGIDSLQLKLKIYDKNRCGPYSISKTVYIPKHNQKIIAPDTACELTSINIHSTESSSKYQYQWYIDNVLISNTTSSITIDSLTLGTHYIRMSVHYIEGNCTFDRLDTIIVKKIPKVRIDQQFIKSLNKCFPAIDTLFVHDSALTIHKIQWTHEGNTNTSNPTVIALSPGINIINALITTTYGCRLEYNIFDTVIHPRGEIEIERDLICRGDSINVKLVNHHDVESIIWDFGDGNLNSNNEFNTGHRFNIANQASTSTTILAAIYGKNGACPDDININVFVTESIANFNVFNGIDTAFCFRSVPIENMATADSIVWHFGDGRTSNDTTLSQINYARPDTYQITQYTYLNEILCPDTSYKTIILKPIPFINAYTDTICFGDSLEIHFTDTIPNPQIFVSPNLNNQNPYTTSPIKLLISEEQSFKLTSSLDGCADSTEINASVIYPIDIQSLDTIIESGKYVTLPFEHHPLWNFTWTPPLEKPSCKHCSFPELQFIYPARHVVTYSNHKNCFLDSAIYNIDIYPDIRVSVPTAFTPNGDGNNDRIYARGFGIKKLHEFKIYNRQGQLLFMTDDENVGWDGYYKETLQNSEPYYYTYKAESFIPGKILSGEGSFMLLK